MKNISEVEKRTIDFTAVSFITFKCIANIRMSACFEGWMSLKPHASLIKCPPEQNKSLAHSTTNQPTTKLSQRPRDHGRPLDQFVWYKWNGDNEDILKHHLVLSRAAHEIQTWVIYCTVCYLAERKNAYPIMPKNKQLIKKMFLTTLF